MNEILPRYALDSYHATAAAQRQRFARAERAANAPAHAIIQRIAQIADQAHEDDPQWLIDVIAALRPQRGEALPLAIERFTDFAAQIDASETLANILAQRLAAITNPRRARMLLANTGVIDQEHSIGAAMRKRLAERILPSPSDDTMMRDIFVQAFQLRGDALWVESLPPTALQQLIAAVLRAAEVSGISFFGLALESRAAVEILSLQLANIGLDPQWLRYDPHTTQHESPFVAQARECASWCDAHEVGATASEQADLTLAHAQLLILQCDAAATRVQGLSEKFGTSVALTSLIARARMIVERLQLLLTLTAAHPQSNPSITASASLIVALVRGVSDDLSIRALWRTTTHALARRMTEHASNTGEHYMTQTRAEFHQLARSALGAGPIVAVMAIIKLLVVKFQLAPFWEAIALGINYGFGFVLIHMLHFTLATKQPAMTAAKIASTLEQSHRDHRSDVRSERVVDVIAQVSRTQFIAVLANVALALPVGALIGTFLTHLLGAPIISPLKAQSMLTELNPVTSHSLLYAAIAGICLFVAGSISGYADNRTLYTRLPARLRAAPWISKLISARGAENLAHYIEHNAGAIVGNLTLGFMLASVGFFGTIFGIAIDIRHVTLVSANVGIAWALLDFAPIYAALASAAAGIVLIGVTNLVVSFSLALAVALRSRGLQISSAIDMIVAVGQAFRFAPRQFFLPPKN